MGEYIGEKAERKGRWGDEASRATGRLRNGRPSYPGGNFNLQKVKGLEAVAVWKLLKTNGGGTAKPVSVWLMVREGNYDGW